jgi:hypothetical protein
MAVTEPPLPIPLPTGNLTRARDIVVEQVQAWMGAHAGHTTIGHSGPVTQEFIRQQAGMAPRSIVTVADGRAARLGHAMSIQCKVTFTWYVVLRGVIEDRTTKALDFVDGVLRFIYSEVFRDVDSNIFSRIVDADSVRFASKYSDKDEKTAYTIWGIQWQQDISLGAAGRERPGDGILLLINGTDEYPGDPHGDTVEFEVA